MKVILGSKWETYILFAGFAIFSVALGVGCFYLGLNTGDEFDKANLNAIYEQGVTAGMLEMQNQCDIEVASLARNCKEWYDPALRFRSIDLASGK